MIVYEITCLSDGRRYIGSTVRPLPSRWESHCLDAQRPECSTPILRAIRRHGSANFALREVACAPTERDLRTLERAIILQEGTAWPIGFNADSRNFRGGNGGHSVRKGLKRIEEARGGLAAIKALHALRLLRPDRPVAALQAWWDAHRPPASEPYLHSL